MVVVRAVSGVTDAPVPLSTVLASAHTIHPHSPLKRRLPASQKAHERHPQELSSVRTMHTFGPYTRPGPRTTKIAGCVLQLSCEPMDAVPLARTGHAPVVCDALLQYRVSWALSYCPSTSRLRRRFRQVIQVIAPADVRLSP